MTFDEVIKQVQAKGNFHQEELKKALKAHETECGITFKTTNTGYSAFITVTAEQFLKIYEILGE